MNLFFVIVLALAILLAVLSFILNPHRYLNDPLELILLILAIGYTGWVETIALKRFRKGSH